MRNLAVALIVLICALGVALLLAAGAAVGLWRARSSADARVADAVSRLAAGMHETMREFAEAVETAEATARAERFVGELAASLDVDEVMERTLKAAAAIPGVEGALIDTGSVDDALASAVIGMPAEEAARAAVQVPDNDNLRAVELVYRYRIDDVDSSAAVVRSGIVLPIRADGVPIGSLTAFTRSGGRTIDDEGLDELERLALRAGPALENARRYTEARALADLDGLTGLHNRRFFHETLAREVDRAQRYQRSLSVVIVDVDGFKEINDRIGHLAGDAVLAEIAERVREVVRSADIPCRVGGDEFAVILPEIDVERAQQLVSRIERAVSSQPIARAGRVRVSAGVAELLPNDNPTSLFERGDESLYAAKHILKNGLAAAD